MQKTIPVIIIVLLLAAGGLVFFHVNRVATEEASVKNSELLASEDTPQDTSVIVTSEVKYFGEVRGFLTEPRTKGNYPGVIMIHEWWGLNDNIRAMARELARNGYVVLAVDLFGKVAKTTEEAKSQVNSLNEETAVLNLRSAAAYLREMGVERLASLGWCFGGGQSMQLALSGENLDATIIYYGNLVTDEQKLSQIEWPVLGIFGEEDKSIPLKQVKTFESVLKKLEIENEIYVYPGVGHAFANPSGTNYAEKETKDAWANTVTFLAKHLKEPKQIDPENKTVGTTPTVSVIRFTDSGYIPTTIAVKKGAKIIFRNESTADTWPASAIHPTHRIYPDSGIQKCNSDNEKNIFDACRGVKPEAEWSFTFNFPGLWKYHDHLNPKHFGEIKVEP